MWTLIYICWYFRSSLPSGDVNGAGKTICVKKPLAPQPHSSMRSQKLYHAQDSSTHKNIWTAQLDSLVHQYRHYVCIHKLFICYLLLLHSDISLHFRLSSNISNVSSQEHLTTVLGLITCWFCFIKTLSHTKLLAILHKSKFYLDDCAHAHCYVLEWRTRRIRETCRYVWPY